MPEKVIRNGKTYTEYSPQELEKLRMEGHVKQSQRSGRQRTSALLTTAGMSEGKRNTRHMD